MKIITIIGARPQFIKASVLSKKIAKMDSVEEIIVHTGQHFDKNMSDVFFDELQIPHPRYNLDLHGQTHGSMTGLMLIEIEKILLTEKPDLVLVYGDTNSTLAGALAASKLNIPLAHVEAGLRSFNKKMPEEVNRILTDHVSKYLFTPTQTAVDNLINEGFPKNSIHLVGDIMYEACLDASASNQALSQSFLDSYGVQANQYFLTTIHRAESTSNEEQVKNIIQCLNTASQYKPVLWPVHPRTRDLLKKWNLHSSLSSNIKIIDPVGYLTMQALIKNCALVLTDSGGLQKEAYFHHKLCLTLRQETEWIELVHKGWNFLVGLDQEKIKYQLQILSDPNFNQPDFDISLYGDGNTSQKILDILLA